MQQTTCEKASSCRNLYLQWLDDAHKKRSQQLRTMKRGVIVFVATECIPTEALEMMENTLLNLLFMYQKATKFEFLFCNQYLKCCDCD
ncbi:hypothetical protein GIB67_010321 [Kingdonia uniflora]|uniref:Uncharacterized protein n=1 Tax=Kingdonia uniflora TaxID=39325 RepID=A0A7J7LCS9_9MAGN|nr:hypothetical protein GIB67_010321 [Kingdonia uniflora]